MKTNNSKTTEISLFDRTVIEALKIKFSSSGIKGRVPQIIDLYESLNRKNEFEYLEQIFSRIPSGRKKNNLRTSFLSEDDGNHIGALAELMIFDWLEKLGKNPSFETLLPGNRETPDLLINNDDRQIIIEVAAVQESIEDQIIMNSHRGFWPGATSTYKSMGSRLAEKAGKYAKYQKPYVICIYLANSIIQLGQIKDYFLGDDTYNFSIEKLQREYNGIIFENNNDEILVKHRHVSGILVAKRNRGSIEEGFKLNFGLIQNPYAHPCSIISPDEFGSIPRYIVSSPNHMEWRVD